ncbi:hypothetical protein HA72_2187 [Metallosphaera sedula]|uniref:Uncharacterized protein n=3 Tax=Metallosphaera sedula TaxID=43687 RepID=A4YIS4_METS5|nr:hypothetical protein Msed_2187 [Metallosphaera sedula DSM 5348]AIM28309.1 hypothetical protein HA72_2187 [Metallosphaera sedula]AKV75110.1 hypothetical protein MsedA_2240 [Metallosphaera sedula]AKV77348.1 hypothetical protein MsedB_2242 [Metallosphaera sedula]AKV79599.1 hypothetical protein MsedC_2240 [Metallosphaera sedula]
MLNREVLANVWNDTIIWYIERCRYWARLVDLMRMEDNHDKKLSLLDKAYGLWGHIWHEQDLVMIFSHILLKNLENTSDVHLHISYELKPENFSVITSFHERLSKAVTTLRKELNMKRAWFPEMDLIVTEDEPPFFYCIEFKYYHYFPTTWNIVEDLKRKVVILNTLKKYEVCKDAGIFLLDDGICRKNEELCNKINEVLNEANSLMILSYYVKYEELLNALAKISSKS